MLHLTSIFLNWVLFYKIVQSPDGTVWTAQDFLKLELFMLRMFREFNSRAAECLKSTCTTHDTCSLCSQCWVLNLPDIMWIVEICIKFTNEWSLSALSMSLRSLHPSKNEHRMILSLWKAFFPSRMDLTLTLGSQIWSFVWNHFKGCHVKDAYWWTHFVGNCFETLFALMHC